MRKQYVSLLAFLIATGAFYVSCDGRMSKPTGALEFDNITMDESVHLFGDTAKPGAKLIIDFAYVDKSNDDSLMAFLNDQFIAICFDSKYMHTDVKTVVQNYAGDYTGEYRMDLEPMFLEDQRANNREDQLTIASWYDYYQNIKSEVQLYEKDILIYKVDFDEYTGGAHGMNRTNFLNIDLKNQHVLTLDDIFVDDYSDALVQLLWEQLMIDNNVSSREELEHIGFGLIGDVEPVENFFLDKTGITFFYNVYEIAPYSIGPVQIKLSYPSISLITKEVKIISDLQKS